MKPAEVVPTLDAVEHRRVQSLAGRPGSGLDQGTLERGKEALGHGVVPAIRPCARSTSGRRSAGPVCRGRPSCTDSPVRVGDQAFHRVAIAERHGECAGHEQATGVRRTAACSLLRLDAMAAFIGSPGQREPWLACVTRCPHAGPGSPGAAGEHGPLLGRQTGPFAGHGDSCVPWSPIRTSLSGLCPDGGCPSNRGEPSAQLSLPGRVKVKPKLESSQSLRNPAQLTSSLKISALLPIQFVESGATRSYRVGGRRMSEPEAFRICPHCGSQEVPKLIVRSARISGNGSSWRCRDCNRDWSDAEYCHIRAS